MFALNGPRCTPRRHGFVLFLLSYYTAIYDAHVRNTLYLNSFRTFQLDLLAKPNELIIDHD